MVTTTLYDILDAKFNRMGYNNIRDPETGRMITHGNENSTPYQLARFSDVAYQAVNEEIFAGYVLQSVEADRYFKHLFIDRFLHRQIKFQTLDIFRAKATSLLASNDQYISELYDNFADLVRETGTSQSKSSSNSGKTNRERSADVDLPQDNTDLDLNDDTVEYANETHYRKGSEEGNTTGNEETTTQRVSIGNLKQMKDLFNELLDEMEPQLFMAFWY